MVVGKSFRVRLEKVWRSSEVATAPRELWRCGHSHKHFAISALICCADGDHFRLLLPSCDKVRGHSWKMHASRARCIAGFAGKYRFAMNRVMEFPGGWRDTHLFATPSTHHYRLGRDTRMTEPSLVRRGIFHDATDDDIMAQAAHDHRSIR